MFRLKHDKHGWMHAYYSSEVEALKKLGWYIEEPEQVAQTSPSPTPPSLGVAQVEPPVAAPKRGRPRKS